MSDNPAEPILTVHEQTLDAIACTMASGSKLYWHPDPHSYVIEAPDGRMWLYEHRGREHMPIVDAMREILYASGSRPPAPFIEGAARSPASTPACRTSALLAATGLELSKVGES